MELTTFTDAKQFLAQAGEDMSKYEVHNGLMLGALQEVANQKASWLTGEPYLATVYEKEKFLTAAMITPPFGLVLAQGDENSQAAIELVARDLQARHRPVPDVNGPKFYAGYFAQTWSAITGHQHKLMMAERMYDLRQVIPPGGIPGTARLAAPEDREWLVDWMDEFSQEALDEENTRSELLTLTNSYLAEERVMLWQHDQQPVSMSVQVRDSARGAMIGCVYTPIQHRRHGYASALVAFHSQHCLDNGRDFCMLFTDLANPTSNSIYQQIGYRPVCDFDKYRFI